MTLAPCPVCGHDLTLASATCPGCGTPAPAGDGVTATAAPPAPDAVTAAHDGGTAPEPAAAPPTRLPTIPGYEVLGVIGRGGMGVVYRCRQLNPRRVVAVKMLLAGGSTRFEAEVAAVARLAHPHVVPIHEVGAVNGRPFFSMEYVGGGTLAARLRDGPLAARDAAAVVAQLARGVQHAHDRGIVHRDLKPANVLLAGASADVRADSPLSPKIADFGVAKHLEGSGGAGVTASGAILGTPSYMAPEQARGRSREVGPAVDVYALGAVLYECLTGRPPFKAEAQLATLKRVLEDDPTPPRRLNPTVPRDLEVVCLKCLRKEPTSRYASAAELADDLDRFGRGEPVSARGRTARERVGGWAGHRRGLLLAAAGAAAVVVAALALLPGPSPKGDPPPAEGLPPDLQLVPPDAFAFVSVRSADLWANPAVPSLLDLRDRPPDGMTKPGAAAAEISGLTSLPPADIERATIVFRRYGGTRDPLIILATRGPYTAERLEAFLAPRGKHAPVEVAGRRVFNPTVTKRDLAFAVAADGVLVLGDPEEVAETLTGPPAGRGPLTGAIDRAAGRHTLVAALNPPPDFLIDFLTKAPKLAPAAPLSAIRTVGVAVTAGHPAGKDETAAVAVEAWATFPDAGRAEEARPHARAALAALLGETVLKPRDAPTDALDSVVAPVLAAEWRADGDTLRASANGSLSVAAYKARVGEFQAAELNRGKLGRVARAVRDYHTQNGRYPPAVVRDEAGRPLYSWRVLVLPHLGGETVYRRFHLNRAWDHPSNRPLLAAMPEAFAPPNTTGATTTAFQVPAGPGGVFDAPDGRRMIDVTDGASVTLLVVQAARPVPWSSPEDVAFDGADPPALGGRDGFHAATVDGVVRFVRPGAATPAVLRALFTRAGRERVEVPWDERSDGTFAPPVTSQGAAPPK